MYICGDIQWTNINIAAHTRTLANNCSTAGYGAVSHPFYGMKSAHYLRPYCDCKMWIFYFHVCLRVKLVSLSGWYTPISCLINCRVCCGYTMDIISSTSFGIEVNSQKEPNNKFVYYAKKAAAGELATPVILFLSIYYYWTLHFVLSQLILLLYVICYFYTLRDRRGRELPVQPVPITTNVVSLNPTHGWVYSIQGYVIRRVWKYHMGNQNPYIEKNRQHNGQTKKYKRANIDLQKNTHKTKDQVTRTPPTIGGELRCSGRVKFVSDLRQVGGFLWFSPQINLTATI
jgi:hypothetical protein